MYLFLTNEGDAADRALIYILEPFKRDAQAEQLRGTFFPGPACLGIRACNHSFILTDPP